LKKFFVILFSAIIFLATLNNANIFANETLISVRETFEQQGYTVNWNAATATVTITNAAANIDIPINSHQITINGEHSAIETPATIINNQTMLPTAIVNDILTALNSNFNITVEPFENFENIENIEPLATDSIDEIQAVESITFILEETAEIRNALWQADITQLRDEISQRHSLFWDNTQIFVPADALNEESGRIAAWNALPRNITLRNNAISALDALIADVPNLTDFEIAIAMQSAISNLQDNHFQILPWEIRANDIPLFVEFRHFGGANTGFFLVNAPTEFSHAVNHKVVAINEVPINAVIERFSAFVSVENIYDARTRLASTLNSPMTLSVLGLFENGEVTFTMENPQNGEQTAITLTENYRLITEEDFYRLENVSGRAAGEMPSFFTLDARNSFHFYEEQNLLYIRLEGFDPTVYTDAWEIMLNLGAETFSEVETEIRQAILDGTIGGIISPPVDFTPANWLDDEVLALWEVHPGILEIVANNEIEAIIVDVRYNVGGDSGVFTQLFNLIRETVPAERIYYFINGGSLSASTTTAFAMRAWGATIVGEPMGQNTIFHGVFYREDDEDEPGALVILENSQITAEIPNLLSFVESDILNIEFDYNVFFELSPNFEFYTFRPDVLIEHTIDDWINNRDPLLEFVIGEISQ